GGGPGPGLRVGIGDVRLVLAVAQAGALRAGVGVDAYIAWVGDGAYGLATKLARDLRREGLSVEIRRPTDAAKLKKSLEVASKLSARYSIIIGEDEVAKGRYQVKDMTSGQQEEVEPARLVAYLKVRMGTGG